MPTVIPSPVPHGSTSRRLTWELLPPAIRALIAERCGVEVARVDLQGAGFTPGFAAVVTGADGSQHFVKAASVVAQRPFADAYRQEARVLAALPAGTPAPRLRWQHVDSAWVVLGLQHVPSRQPERPWTQPDLDATLDALEVVADRLDPPPPGLRLRTFVDEFADLPGMWHELFPRGVDVPGLHEHASDAATLAAAYGRVCAGTALVHTDVRDDNVLVRPDGTALLCDWNWPCTGASWIDSVTALIGPRGDGFDVEPVLAARRLTAAVPGEDVDVLLALLAGFFLRQATEPVPNSSPYLRASQRWQGEVVWQWLGERRGWW